MPMTFREHLDHASAIVATWPKWKREILGDKESKMPMAKDEAVELLKAHADLPMGVISRQQMLEMIDMLASAIIPTPELREAVEMTCRLAVSAIETAERLSPHENFGLASEAVATVRAAFKEPDNA